MAGLGLAQTLAMLMIDIREIVLFKRNIKDGQELSREKAKAEMRMLRKK